MSDIKRFAGYGATEKDLARGFMEPNLPERPEFDADCYKNRWVRANGDENIWDSETFRFRHDHMESKGFLSRLVLPTER